jgi:hypothetical protein
MAAESPLPTLAGKTLEEFFRHIEKGAVLTD